MSPRVDSEAAALGIPRWMRLALPEDVRQEVALTFVEYPNLTPTARRQLVRYRLARLRHEVWDRRPTRPPKTPHGLRPSKLARRRGYRRNKEVTAC